MADAMDLKQSRKWMVTINNPEEHGFTHDRILEIMSSVRGKSLYWCMCDEEGDECETRHTHVFIYRSSPFTARQIDNLFPKMHRDVCYGKAQESRACVPPFWVIISCYRRKVIMSIKKRVVSLFLCFVLGTSVIASSIPAAGAVELPDRADISEYIMRVTMTAFKFAGEDFPTGEVRKDTLESICKVYNDTLAGLQRGSILPIPDFTPTPWDLLGPAVITEEANSGIRRLIDSDNNVFITDEWGNYPYYYVGGYAPAEDIAVSNVHANKWCGLTERSKEVEPVTQDALASAVIELSDAGTECSLVKGYYNEVLYYFICTPDYKYYCNSKNEMFVAPAEASATDLNRPYIDDDGNPLDIDKIIDRDNNILNLPGENGLNVELSIGNLNYNEGDKSWTVNAYTTINEGDNYYYTYYTYNVTYAS